MADVENKDLKEGAAGGAAADADPDEEMEEEEEHEAVSWGEVCRSCCCHSPAVWAMILFRMVGVLFFLYFFILGLGKPTLMMMTMMVCPPAPASLGKRVQRRADGLLFVLAGAHS
jgi:hypothetical protein